MGKYTDDEIRNFSKITCKIAADYLGVSPMAVSIGMRNDLLPIGFAIHNEDQYTDSWSYLAKHMRKPNVNAKKRQDCVKNAAIAITPKLSGRLG